jgi:hypothetical protein
VRLPPLLVATAAFSKGRYLLGGCSSLLSHPIALSLLKGSRQWQSGQCSVPSPLVLREGVAINFAPHFGQVSRSICPIARAWRASDGPSIPRGFGKDKILLCSHRRRPVRRRLTTPVACTIRSNERLSMPGSSAVKCSIARHNRCGRRSLHRLRGNVT